MKLQRRYPLLLMELVHPQECQHVQNVSSKRLPTD